MYRTIAFASALALLALSPPAALADEIEDQVDTALGYYKEGDLAGTITELQFVINAIRSQLAGRYVKTFPPPPAGWEAEDASEAEGMAFLGGGTTLSRAYKKTDGDATIDAQLMIDNPMIQTLGAMFSNPAILAAQPNMKRIRIGRDNAILDTDSKELTFMVGNGRGMIQLTGHNLDNDDVLVDLLKSWNLKALKDVAGM
ncbi:MAG: hypothetical protein KDG89_05155 [Geminicoccaceae bacterium]|nr:hypothetical protein [Geminicoccaceae bacterium]